MNLADELSEEDEDDDQSPRPKDKKKGRPVSGFLAAGGNAKPIVTADGGTPSSSQSMIAGPSDINARYAAVSRKSKPVLPEDLELDAPI
jgi:hypothetical protein